MPSSFMNMISMKTIHVQGRSTAAFSGELCLLLFMGNFSAAVPAVCHWWWLELFSMSLLVAFIFYGVFPSKVINYFKVRLVNARFIVQGLLDEVFDCKREIFSFLEKFLESSSIKSWLTYTWFWVRWTDLYSACFYRLKVTIFFGACSDQVDQNSRKCLWQISRLECLQWNPEDIQHPATPRRTLLLQGWERLRFTSHKVHKSGRVL